MDSLQLNPEYSMALPLALFTVYLWKSRSSIKRPGRLVTSTVFALSLSFALSVWKPVTTPYGPLSFVDVGVMTSAMLFGPIIGGFAGSLGPALGALLGGGYSIPVLVVARGLEGLVTGHVSSNTEGSSGRILGGVLGGAVAISVVVAFTYLSGDAGGVNRVLSTMLAEVSTGIMIGTGLSGIIRGKAPWTGDVL